MHERRSHQVQLALIALMVVAGLWAWHRLPPGARVPIHFDAQGAPNGWAGPAMGLLLMPLLAGVLWGLQALLPRLDPLRENLRRSASAVGTIWTALTLLLAVLQGVIVAAALGLPAPRAGLGLVLVGGLFIAVGNVLGKLRPNHLVGIRTVWTLADERVWDQTHRFGGKAFVLGGALLWLLAAWPPDLGFDWHGPAIVAVSLAIAAASVLKSWLLWRARQPPGR